MKKNNSKLKAAAAVVLAALLLIAVNLCVSKLSEKLGLRLDMTGNKLYELSDETLNVLGELDMPVDIKVFSAEEDFTPLVAEVLRRYEQAGDGLTVKYIDPYTKPTVVDEYIQKGLEINLNTVVVEGGSYACAIDLEDMFVLDSSGQSVQQLNCEQLLTSAVLRAEGARSRSAVFIAGHNEYVSDTLRELLTQNNYSVSDISLSLKDIAEGTDLAVIAAPTSDFSSEEIAKLDAYMAAGGRLLVFAEPSSGELTKLDAFLREWGIGLSDTVVAEKTQFTDANPLSIVPIYSGHEINSYFSANRLYLVMPSTVALEQEFVSRGSISIAKLLYSTDRSYDANDTAGESGPFTLAMAAEKTDGDTRARLAVIGSRGIYSDSLMSSGTNGNARFIAQCVAWCTEADTAVSIPARSISDEPVSVTLGQVIILAALLILVLPVGLLVQGISVYLKRRHS